MSPRPASSSQTAVPAAWHARNLATAFVDLASTRVAGAGPAFRVAASRRAPSLVDYLEAFTAHGVERVYVVGPDPLPEAWRGRPGGTWTIAKRGHYPDGAYPRFAFESRLTGWHVEIRRAAAFYGDADLPTAHNAQLSAAAEIRRAFRIGDDRPALFGSPAATGRQLLGVAGARLGRPPGPELAELIRSTSPQHRIEVVGACYGECDAHAAAAPLPWQAIGAAIDQTFAYASLCSELGTGGRLLTLVEAEQLANSQPYARARYLVRFRVPDEWAAPGLLMTKHPDGRHWHTPNRPGWHGETWCDAVELLIARRAGWHAAVLGGIAFEPGRPLDVWRDRLVASWTRLREAGHTAAAGAIRAIVLHTIGSLHSLGADEAHHAETPLDVPTIGVTGRTDNPDGTVTYYTPRRLTGDQAAFAHPELSSQIWARAHARLASSPDGAGFLDHGRPVWGLWGDAQYLAFADAPAATLHGVEPRPGRYRLKGTTPGPVAPPGTMPELIALRDTMGDT